MIKTNLNLFKGRTILITGGTGSFGSTILKKLLKLDPEEIRIFSRDEKKQHDLRLEYNNPKIKFVIGDVRDKESCDKATLGVDFIFHAAALKQVPSCEFFPIEATKTNVLGTNNILNAAIQNNVKKVICLSTDKAAYPINAMGISKALMEKTAVSLSRYSTKTEICITRYGNVMASRGSVIPHFINQLKEGKKITITNPYMTRFLMTLDEAVDLVLFAFKNGKNGDLFIQKAPASTIKDLGEAISQLMGMKFDYKIIGTRHGEKLYETLATKEEMTKAEDLGNYFRIPADQRDLNYNSYFIEGQEEKIPVNEYNSANTQQLNVKEIKTKLLKLKEISFS